MIITGVAIIFGNDQRGLSAPITNLPPVVTIAATDPLAIEGTNCWGWPSISRRIGAAGW